MCGLLSAVLVVAVAQAAANLAPTQNKQEKLFWDFSWTNPCTGEESKYSVFTTPMGFHEAELYCQTEFNGHLASPSTEMEDMAIKFALFRFPFGNYSFLWFGGHMVGDHWEFTNGEMMNYTGWHGNPTDSNYGSFGPESNNFRDWVSLPQEDTPIGGYPQFPFVCEA